MKAWRRLTYCALVALPLTCAAVPPGITTAINEALELAAKRSGRVLAGPAEREAAQATMEASIVSHGQAAISSVRDGGIELLEATRTHGPDVMDMATKLSAPARRMLALKANELMPVARGMGPEAFELEAKAPGMTQRVVDVFGMDGARDVAAKVAPEDIPRLVMYGEKAPTVEARKALLERYLKLGPSVFARALPSEVLTKGLSDALVLGGLTALASQVMPYLSKILLALAALALVGLLIEWWEWRKARAA